MVLFEDVPEEMNINPKFKKEKWKKNWVFGVSSICRSYSGTFLQKTWDFKLDEGPPEIV